MDEIDKYYDILDLEPGAKPEEVKQAYRDLVKVWHPDRFSHDPKLLKRADEKLKEINEAFTRLQSFQTDLERSHISWEEYKRKAHPQAADTSQSTIATPPKPRPPADISILTEHIRFMAIWPIKTLFTIIVGLVITWLIHYMIAVKSPVRFPMGDSLSSIQSALKTFEERLSSSMDHHNEHNAKFFQPQKFGSHPHNKPAVRYFFYNKNFTTRRQPTMIVPGDQENRSNN